MLEQGFGTENFKKHKNTMIQKMARYLDSRNCRRQFILDHFEGKNESNPKPKSNCCDNCTRMYACTQYLLVKSTNTKLIQFFRLKDKKDCDKYEGLDSDGCFDFTEDSYTFISAVSALNSKFGVQMYILFLKGSNSSKLYTSLKRHPLYGSGAHKTEDWWKGLGTFWTNAL